ncbi:hypothetical protein DFH11DRAFT_1547985 [Phellopilus nigrolimitatus]|nr:hypothetical protein DFH11DRAFT_1547985 [Phellopilus nigrolimitatus]
MSTSAPHEFKTVFRVECTRLVQPVQYALSCDFSGSVTLYDLVDVYKARMAPAYHLRVANKRADARVFRSSTLSDITRAEIREASLRGFQILKLSVDRPADRGETCAETSGTSRPSAAMQARRSARMNITQRLTLALRALAARCFSNCCTKTLVRGEGEDSPRAYSIWFPIWLDAVAILVIQRWAWHSGFVREPVDETFCLYTKGMVGRSLFINVAYESLPKTTARVSTALRARISG